METWEIAVIASLLTLFMILGVVSASIIASKYKRTLDKFSLESRRNSLELDYVYDSYGDDMAYPKQHGIRRYSEVLEVNEQGESVL